MSNKRKTINDIVIVGAGGLGREVFWQFFSDTVPPLPYNFLGFIDDTPEKQGKDIYGYPVLGTIEDLSKTEKPLCAVICIADIAGRKKIAEKLHLNANISFPSLIAHNVCISPTANIGMGCIICFSCIISVDTKIGNFCIINFNCTIAHDAIINDYVTIHPNVNISGNTKIGFNNLIGTGAQVIEKVTIGDNTVIGAGSMILTNTVDNHTYLGVPGKIIK